MTRPGRLLLGLLTLGFILNVSQAMAQTSSVAPDIVTANGPLSGDQKVALEKFIGIQTTKLLSGEQDQMGPARERLLSPTKHPNVSDHFLLAYAPTLVAKLKPGVQSKNDLVRINTFTVMASLATPTVADLCMEGLADKNPAVRYWATRTAANQKSNTFNAGQQKKLIANLGQSLNSERNFELARHGYTALSRMAMPEAEQAILAALEARLNMQVKGCKASLNDNLRADVEAVRVMLGKLTEASVGGKDVRKQRVQLVRVTAKYLVLCSESLATGKLSDGAEGQDLRPACEELIKLAERLFNGAITEPGFKGPALGQYVKKKDDWFTLFGNTMKWVGSAETGKGILTAKLNIPLKDLLICTAAQKAAAKSGN